MALDKSLIRESVMHVRSGHWLDHDPIALVVLVIGLGAIALLVLSM